MTHQSPDAVYACVNLDSAVTPREIELQSVCINADIGEVMRAY